MKVEKIYGNCPECKQTIPNCECHISDEEKNKGLLALVYGVRKTKIKNILDSIPTGQPLTDILRTNISKSDYRKMVINSLKKHVPLVKSSRRYYGVVLDAADEDWEKANNFRLNKLK